MKPYLPPPTVPHCDFDFDFVLFAISASRARDQNHLFGLLCLLCSFGSFSLLRFKPTITSFPVFFIVFHPLGEQQNCGESQLRAAHQAAAAHAHLAAPQPPHISKNMTILYASSETADNA